FTVSRVPARVPEKFTPKRITASKLFPQTSASEKQDGLTCSPALWDLDIAGARSFCCSVELPVALPAAVVGAWVTIALLALVCDSEGGLADAVGPLLTAGLDSAYVIRDPFKRI